MKNNKEKSNADIMSFLPYVVTMATIVYLVGLGYIFYNLP